MYQVLFGALEIQNRPSLPSWSSHSSERQAINKIKKFWNMVESSNCCRGKLKKRRGVESEERDIIFKEVRNGLTQKVTCEQRLKEVKKQSTQRTEGSSRQQEQLVQRP